MIDVDESESSQCGACEHEGSPTYLETRRLRIRDSGSSLLQSSPHMFHRFDNDRMKLIDQEGGHEEVGHLRCCEMERFFDSLTNNLDGRRKRER